MRTYLEFQGQIKGIVENDYCTINYDTKEILWKAGMFNPKMQNNILYWFNELNNQIK